MSTGTMRGVLDAYFDGINGEHYEAVAALFAPDGVLVAPGVKPRTGPAEIAEYFTVVLARYPVHHDQPTRTLVDGRTATVEIDFTGELGSGAPMTFQAVDVFDLDAVGKIARLVTWYDSHLVRGRLVAAEASVGEPGATTRAALRGVRTGVAIALVGAWRVPPSEPLATRVRVHGEPGEERPGDALLVHGDVDLATLPLDRLSAVIASGAVTGDEPFPTAEHWDLSAARAGLLVALANAAGAAIWI